MSSRAVPLAILVFLAALAPSTLPAQQGLPAPGGGRPETMDIIYVVDSSRSMERTDPKKVRLVMLRALADFFRNRPGDRLALLQFAGWGETNWYSEKHGTLLFPLTAVPADAGQRDAFFRKFKDTIARKLKEPFGVGTDFNVALDQGVSEVLKQRDSLGKVGKVWVVLFTDGDTEIRFRGARDKYLAIAKAAGRDPREDRDALNDAANEVFYKEVLPRFEKMDDLFFTPVDLRLNQKNENPILLKLSQKSARPGIVVHSSGNLIRDVFLRIITMRPGADWLNRNVYGYQADRVRGRGPYKRTVHIYAGTADNRVIIFADTAAFTAKIGRAGEAAGLDPKKVVHLGAGERYRILELGKLPPGDYELAIEHGGKVKSIETAVFAEFRVRTRVVRADGKEVYKLGETAQVEIAIEGFDGKPITDRSFIDELEAVVQLDRPDGEKSEPVTVRFEGEKEARKIHPVPFTAASPQGVYRVHVAFRGVGNKGSMMKIKDFGFSAKAEPLELKVLPVLKVTPARMSALVGQKVRLEGKMTLGKIESADGVEAKAIFAPVDTQDGTKDVAADLSWDAGAGAWSGEVILIEPGKWKMRIRAFDAVAVGPASDFVIEVKSRSLTVRAAGASQAGWTPDLKWREKHSVSGEFQFELEMAEGETAAVEAVLRPAQGISVGAVSARAQGLEGAGPLTILGPGGTGKGRLILDVNSSSELPQKLGTIAFTATVNGAKVTAEVPVDATYSDRMEKLLRIIIPVAAALLLLLILILYFALRAKFIDHQIRPIVPGRELDVAYLLKDLGGRKSANGTPEVAGAVNFRLPGRKADVRVRALTGEMSVYVNGRPAAQPVPVKHGDSIEIETADAFYRYKYFSRAPLPEELMDTGLDIDDDEIIITG